MAIEIFFSNSELYSVNHWHYRYVILLFPSDLISGEIFTRQQISKFPDVSAYANV